MPERPDTPPGRIWDDPDALHLRRALIRYFGSRGLSHAEDLTNEVFVRICKKLGRLFADGPTEKDRDYDFLMRLYEKYSSGRDIAGDEECARDLAIYAFSIANNIAFEQKRARRRLPLPEEYDEEHPRTTPDVGQKAEKEVHRDIFPEEAKEVHEKCMDECLQTMPKDAKLLLKFYDTDKKKDSSYHRKLAEELAMKLETLYVAVYRARRKVRECFVSCMERELPGSSRFWCKE